MHSCGDNQTLAILQIIAIQEVATFQCVLFCLFTSPPCSTLSGSNHVLNKLHKHFFPELQSVMVGYKRGVVRSVVFCRAHNHGGQIHTLKKKLHKLNSNAQHTIVATSQMTIQYSVGDV